MKQGGRKKKKPAEIRLAVGERWFVKLPGAQQLSCVFIDEMTALTLVLHLEADLGSHTGLLGRYARKDIEFVERVP